MIFDPSRGRSLTQRFVRIGTLERLSTSKRPVRCPMFDPNRRLALKTNVWVKGEPGG